MACNLSPSSLLAQLSLAHAFADARYYFSDADELQSPIAHCDALVLIGQHGRVTLIAFADAMMASTP